MDDLSLDIDLKGARSPATPCKRQAGDLNASRLSPHAFSLPSEGYGPLDIKSPRCTSSQSSQSVNDWIGLERGKKPFFDICTIRTWFMEMDIERSGHVSKQGFMQFIRGRPQLRHLFIHAGQERYKIAGGRKNEITGQEAEALEIRRLLKLLKEIDQDGNGTLEWEEFLDFWRVAGFLLEYDTKNNPREQIADVLGQIHEGHTNGVSDDRLSGHLSALAKEHMSSQSRRKSEDLSNNQKPPDIVNRRSSEPFVQVGKMTMQMMGANPVHRTPRRKSDSFIYRSATME